MANATNTLTATITSTDSNGNTSINRGIGSPALPGQVAAEVLGQLLAIGDNVITLPAANCFNLYVKNNAAPASGQKIIVKWTPSGGVQQTSPELEPGGVFAFWNVINTVATGGFTALTLNASAASVPVDYIIGA